jgi:hypothetical protein
VVKWTPLIVCPLFHSPGNLAAVPDGRWTDFTEKRKILYADALDLQIQGADERSRKTYGFIEPTGIEIFGTPNPATLNKMKKIAGSGITVSISPHYFGGFIR